MTLLLPSARAQDFSLDAVSVEVPGTLSAADVALLPGIPPIPLAMAGGPSIVPPGLGLPAGVDVDGLSYGVDQVTSLGSASFMAFFFSVTRGSVGAPGSAVAAETNGVGGDRYTCTASTLGAFTGQTLSTDAPLLGLTPLPGPESNIDALTHLAGAPLGVGAGFKGGYVSLTPATAGLAGVTPATILYNGPFLPPLSPPVVWALPAALGLVLGDDIDGLMVNDAGIVGTLDPADDVWVSLAPGSPTLGLLGASAADVISVTGGPPAVAVTAAQLSLLPTDDLDAVTIFDPGPWDMLGGGKPGGGGVQPAFLAQGSLMGGATGTFEIRGATPGAPGVLVLGLSELSAPFKQGTLVPSPDLLLNLPATPTGALTLPYAFPPGLPPGVPIFLQHWVMDPGATLGLAATNGVRGTSQ